MKNYLSMLALSAVLLLTTACWKKDGCCNKEVATEATTTATTEPVATTAPENLDAALAQEEKAEAMEAAK